ncbi:adenylate/guanylate cyclase domain-containing protein [Lacipirellula limnantheis]|uniref:Adenylate cyclase 2 n=1 Tax=Lacipirellula limnantheis TaxID=2528024 RepID=A0A517U070_9BACT|nr:adenylate/guanylate cyclase domain-containing protein [Lacipirellula limnantheis]QDT74022.1 Adenylate cyclase 2 [Lacipirellula limnantheis]
MTSPEPPPPLRDAAEVSPAFPVLCYRHRQRILATQLDATLEIGRQREEEPPPVMRLDHSQGARIILAPIDDVAISRAHVGLALAAGGQVQVKNLSTSQPVRVSPNQTLAPGDDALVIPPALLQFGDYAVRVDPAEDEQLELEGLPERTIPPGKQAPPASVAMLGATFDESKLLRWLETILGVFQSAANTHDFPEQAARAAVKIVGLDAAAVLRFDDGRWRTEALHAGDQREGDSQTSWAPSQTLLGWVRRDRRTFRHVPPTGPDTPRSLQNVSALVAAPILNGAGEVIGALYGDRRSGGSSGGFPRITEFEAKLVELLASGIAAGLARLKEEQAAVEARVQFEQFFTPQLATQLQRDPTLLEGRNAEVTILFADIRCFSRISERLGPDRTMAWIQDTMGALSESVLAYNGVLVDYIGDELMAMWGAPAPQSDHAALACLAAKQMMESLAAISARWQQELGVPVQLGIGLNSGLARVGNTGSSLKFKYGPLGDAVNVASRVQGATKYLGADCLITGETLKRLPSGVAHRRLARVRAVNIAHPIDLYEIVAQPTLDWNERRHRYDAALLALEQENWSEAFRNAQRLAGDYPDDAAAAALLKRVEAAERTSKLGDTSVWQLPGK